MFRKILVYEDALAEKHPALQRALQLVGEDQVELKVVDVVDGPSNAVDKLHRPMRSLVDQERKDRLQAMCEPLHERGIPHTTELIRGRPFVEIVREVVHAGFHLVIKTASLAVPTEVLGMMGPVDMRLVRNCPCPIWLESPSRDVDCKRVLVAVDPQAEDDQLNKALLAMGVSLAKAAGFELHVVAAWEVPHEEFLTKKMNPEKLARYAEDLRSAARQNLDDLLVSAGKPLPPRDVHFRQGDAARAILECAESLRPDVLLIGTVGRTDVRGLLIGNTADTVLRQVSCAVLAVKPDSLFRV